MQDHSEGSVDVARYLTILLRYAWLVILGAVAGGVLMWLRAGSPADVYSAKTTILVQQNTGNLNVTAGDIQTSGQLAGTYRRLITTRPMFEASAEAIGGGVTAGQIRSAISVEQEGAQFITITARTGNPTDAERFANIVAESFIERTRNARLVEIANLQRAALAQGIDTSSVLQQQLGLLDTLTVVEAAIRPGGPIAVNTESKLMLGAIMGLLIGAGLAFLLDYTRDVVRSRERFEGQFNLSVFAVIPKTQHPGPEVGPGPDQSFREAVRFLRTNLQFIPGANDIKSIMITSAEPGAGKSTITAHLALALAESGKRVVAIDCDLRRPALARMLLRRQPEVGVSNYLADSRVGYHDLVQSTDEWPNLTVVGSGPSPPSPSDLLNTPRLAALIHDAAESADVVLMDGPPILAVSDSAILASQADAAIVVVDTAKSRSRAIRAALKSLDQVQATVVGAVLNKYRRDRFGVGYYGYDYHGYYGYYSTAPSDNGTEPSLDGTNNRRMVARIRNLARRATKALPWG